jgi:hypothetical protein
VGHDRPDLVRVDSPVDRVLRARVPVVSADLALAVALVVRVPVVSVARALVASVARVRVVPVVDPAAAREVVPVVAPVVVPVVARVRRVVVAHRAVVVAVVARKNCCPRRSGTPRPTLRSPRASSSSNVECRLRNSRRV